MVLQLLYWLVFLMALYFSYLFSVLLRFLLLYSSYFGNPSYSFFSTFVFLPPSPTFISIHSFSLPLSSFNSFSFSPPHTPHPSPRSHPYPNARYPLFFLLLFLVPLFVVLLLPYHSVLFLLILVNSITKIKLHHQDSHAPNTSHQTHTHSLPHITPASSPPLFPSLNALSPLLTPLRTDSRL